MILRKVKQGNTPSVYVASSVSMEAELEGQVYSISPSRVLSATLDLRVL